MILKGREKKSMQALCNQYKSDISKSAESSNKLRREKFTGRIDNKIMRQKDAK